MRLLAGGATVAAMSRYQNYYVRIFSGERDMRRAVDRGHLQRAKQVIEAATVRSPGMPKDAQSLWFALGRLWCCFAFNCVRFHLTTFQFAPLRLLALSSALFHVFSCAFVFRSIAFQVLSRFSAVLLLERLRQTAQQLRTLGTCCSGRRVRRAHRKAETGSYVLLRQRSCVASHKWHTYSVFCARVDMALVVRHDVPCRFSGARGNPH